MPPTPALRLRTTRSALLVAFFLAVCVSPVALAGPALALLFLVPLAFALWVVRSGVDVDTEGVTVRALVGRRRVRWDEVAALRLDRHGGLWLALYNGRMVRLPVARARHLAALSAASGGRFDAPTPGAVGPRPSAQ
jgi:hypothetical protein